MKWTVFCVFRIYTGAASESDRASGRARERETSLFLFFFLGGKRDHMDMDMRRTNRRLAVENASWVLLKPVVVS